jgi:hypothetical protein
MVDLENKFLYKRVVVSNVKFPNKKNESKIEGICTFIGKNPTLNKIQITVERMPIFLDSYDQVELAKEKYRKV